MRVLRVLAGIVLVVVSVLLIAGGGALWTAMRHTDASGGFGGRVSGVDSSGTAIVVPDVDAALRSHASLAVRSGTSVTIDVRTPAGPAFLGLAPLSEVRQYLASTRYGEVTSVRTSGGIAISVAPAGATAPVTPLVTPPAVPPVAGAAGTTPTGVPAAGLPGAQSFWTRVGTDGELTWSPSDPAYRGTALVVMRTDGAAPLAATATADVHVRWLGAAAWGLASGGTVAGLIGVVLLLWPARRREIVYVVSPAELPSLAKRLGVQVSALDGTGETSRAAEPDAEGPGVAPAPPEMRPAGSRTAAAPAPRPVPDDAWSTTMAFPWAEETRPAGDFPPAGGFRTASPADAGLRVASPAGGAGAAGPSAADAVRVASSAGGAGTAVSSPADPWESAASVSPRAAHVSPMRIPATTDGAFVVPAPTAARPAAQTAIPTAARTVVPAVRPAEIRVAVQAPAPAEADVVEPTDAPELADVAVAEPVDAPEVADTVEAADIANTADAAERGVAEMPACEPSADVSVADAGAAESEATGPGAVESGATGSGVAEAGAVDAADAADGEPTGPEDTGAASDAPGSAAGGTDGAPTILTTAGVAQAAAATDATGDGKGLVAAGPVPAAYADPATRPTSLRGTLAMEATGAMRPPTPTNEAGTYRTPGAPPPLTPTFM